jgi:hypothetical protein
MRGRGRILSEVGKQIGPALLFERLWHEVGCRAVLEELAAGRQFEFAAERAVFLTVLHRLFVSAGGSTLTGCRSASSSTTILGGNPMRRCSLGHPHRFICLGSRHTLRGAREGFFEQGQEAHSKNFRSVIKFTHCR